MATVYFYRSEKTTDRQYLSNLSKTVIKNVFYKTYGEKLCDCDILKTENGKPYIIKQPDFHFGISHTKNAITVAFSKEPVGVDIEKIRDVDLKVADRFFTEEEQKYINSDVSLSCRRFFEIWTKKEAIIKKSGLKLKDIKTAKRFGCKSVLIDRRDRNVDFGQDYTVTDLNGFWEVLKCGKNFAYHWYCVRLRFSRLAGMVLAQRTKCIRSARAS